MKLKDILNEIQVSRPLSKRAAFDAIYDFNPWLCNYVYGAPSLDEFINNLGYDNISDLLESEYSYEGDELKKAIHIITDYYKVIKPGDVKIGGGKRISVEGYTNAEIIDPEGEMESSFLVLTKF